VGSVIMMVQYSLEPQEPARTALAPRPYLLSENCCRARIRVLLFDSSFYERQGASERREETVSTLI
jgi:hypothetical protein